MLAVALALGSALAWGVADFLGGLKSRELPIAAVAVTSQAAGFAICVVLLVAVAGDRPHVSVLGYGALAGAANAVGISAFYRALALGRMSIVAPLVGMSALVPVVVGLASGERPGGPQYVGIALGIGGVVIASRQLDAGDAGDVEAASRWVIPLAIVAALGIGGNLLWMEKGVTADADASVLWTLAANRAVTVVLIAGAALASGSLRMPGSAALAALLALGALDVTANVLYAVAVRETLLSVAAVLASLHPVATILLARAVLGERLHRFQLGGVVLVMAGICLLAGGQTA
jgi:drug/metabolite transporter (DMT)-like permease